MLQYLMFVFVAFVFWIVLSLDNEVQEEFDIPIEIINVP
ncbi:MAG: YbbR-like domain-containing protein, partial [Muribaculaceae bacterium]|nr:YbbR-like domain-containing protein [Muribaculaceae bacterium]